MSKIVQIEKEKMVDFRKILRVLPLITIISFLGIFFTLWIIFDFNPNSVFKYYLVSNIQDIQYDTYSIKLDTSLPTEYAIQIRESLEEIEYEGVKRFAFVQENEDFVISNSEDSTEYLFKQDLIPVTHFYSLVDDYGFNGVKDNEVFVLDEVHRNFLENELDVSVKVLEDVDALVDQLAESDNYIGFVLFDDLIPDLKVLFMDGEYYLDNQEASIGMYFGIEGLDNEYIYSVLKKNILLGSEFNELDEDVLAKVNMTGVTAISRQLAYKTDLSGDPEYPAEYIGEFLADADLTHTSNEVSFVEGCAVYSGMRFCSNPEYMAALLKSGVDIVSLTGNHNNDFGSTYSASSIEMYVGEGMRYFGGGLNTEDASKILYEEVEGNVIAFLGYNYYDTMLGTGALASTNRSGANSYSESMMEEDILEAKKNSDVVIVDLQFQECWSYPSSNVIYPLCYRPLSSPNQEYVFRKAIDFGADIVVGVQAHQPQTFELYEDGVIFYGLGNLYFDQNNWIGTRQGIILTHYFYSGKHIQTKMTATYMNNNLQTEIATEDQADLLMELLKEARY